MTASMSFSSSMWPAVWKAKSSYRCLNLLWAFWLKGRMAVNRPVKLKDSMRTGCSVPCRISVRSNMIRHMMPLCRVKQNTQGADAVYKCGIHQRKF